MKIDQNTMSVLKNFSNICPAFVYYIENDYIATKSTSDDVLVIAKIPDKFPNEIVLHNLPEFLNITSLIQDPDFTFLEKEVIIRPQGEKRGGIKIKYAHKDAVSMMITKPDMNPEFSDDFVSLDISKELIAQVIKTSNVLDLKHIRVWGNQNGAYIDLLNKDDRDGAKGASFPVSDQSFPDFEMYFESNKFKMRMDYDYILDVSLDEDFQAARFTSKDNTYVYFIAMMA